MWVTERQPDKQAGRHTAHSCERGIFYMVMKIVATYHTLPQFDSTHHAQIYDTHSDSSLCCFSRGRCLGLPLTIHLCRTLCPSLTQSWNTSLLCTTIPSPSRSPHFVFHGLSFPSALQTSVNARHNPEIVFQPETVGRKSLD